MWLRYTLFIILVLLNIADYVTTDIIIDGDPALEANPWASYLIGVFGMKSVLFIKAIPLIWLGFLLKYDVKWMNMALIGLNIALGYIVLRSVHAILFLV